MIYLAYATHNKQGVQVNGHRSRMWAVSEYLDEYNLLSVNGSPPEYNNGDVLIIDSENDDYEHLLSDKVFSVLISDKFGYVIDKQKTNAIFYVSGYCDNLAPILTDSQMIYTVGKDVEKDSWEGGDYVLFLPGSNWNEFWNKAGRFEDYCVDNGIDYLCPANRDHFIEHGILIESAKYAKYVITASGVTAKEMIYMGIPCILILTADNQLSNYIHFTLNQMAFSESTDLETITSNDTLLLSKRIKAKNKLGIPHMLEVVQKLRNIYEADRRNRIELQN